MTADIHSFTHQRGLTPLFPRLYEQAGNESQIGIRQQCLDAIDTMLKHRIAPARSLLEEIRK
jgi:hypothetical protein